MNRRGFIKSALGMAAGAVAATALAERVAPAAPEPPTLPAKTVLAPFVSLARQGHVHFSHAPGDGSHTHQIQFGPFEDAPTQTFLFAPDAGFMQAQRERATIRLETQPFVPGLDARHAPTLMAMIVANHLGLAHERVMREMGIDELQRSYDALSLSIVAR
jgi:hypothetical protein